MEEDVTGRGKQAHKAQVFAHIHEACHVCVCYTLLEDGGVAGGINKNNVSTEECTMECHYRR